LPRTRCAQSAPANVLRSSDFFAFPSPSRMQPSAPQPSTAAPLARGCFNIHGSGRVRMNVRGRAGDCAVILINCILNPAEMDHRGPCEASRRRRGWEGAIIPPPRARPGSLSRLSVRRSELFIKTRKNIDAVIDVV